MVSESVSNFVAIGSPPATADLVWHSALDGDATAIVGSDGVAMGGTPTAATDKNGNVGGAVDFSGGNIYYEIDATPEITSLTSGSISAWVKWNAGAGDQGIVAVGATGGGATEYFSVMRQTENVLRTDLDDGDDGQGRVAPFRSGLAINTWYHLVATFSAQDRVYLYVDGVGSSAGLSTAEASYDGLSTWLIGSERTSSRFLDGAIDDVRIFDHELSGSDVTTLFAAGPLQVPEPSSLILALFGGLFLVRIRRKG